MTDVISLESISLLQYDHNRLVINSMCMRAQSLQSCLTLCNPMDCSWPGSSVHGISQTRILEWVAISSSRGEPGIEPASPATPALAGEFFTTEPSGKSLNR